MFWWLPDERGVWRKGEELRGLRNKNRGSSSQDGDVGRNPSLPCTTKRRIITNLKSINNQKCQKTQLHGTLRTKELKKKSPRTTRLVRWQTARAGSENLWWGSRLGGQGWLKAKLKLRADCGLWRLLWWEKLPVSYESPLESAPETSRQAALLPLWPLPHRQRSSAARRVALPWGIPKALLPYNNRSPKKDIGLRWKNRAKPQ